jgi:hypothetical protein
MNNISLPQKIEVIAYSGYKANERPLSFTMNNRKLEVTSIIDRWYGEEHDYFKVLADDGKVYQLRWHRTMDFWSLEKIVVSGE